MRRVREDRRAMGAPPDLPACGATLCCDSSPNRHATKHARAAAHPVIASAEPGERWLTAIPTTRSPSMRVRCSGVSRSVDARRCSWERFRRPYLTAATAAASRRIAFVDLLRRERAERQAQEPRAPPPSGKNARPSARFTPRAAAAARTAVSGHALRQGQRHEEPTLRTGRDRVRHVPVEAPEAGIEPRP